MGDIKCYVEGVQYYCYDGYVPPPHLFSFFLSIVKSILSRKKGIGGGGEGEGKGECGRTERRNKGGGIQ